jgi:hypothetical protein
MIQSEGFNFKNKLSRNIKSETLIDLLKAGHTKLVPISENGKIPLVLTEEDIRKIREEDRMELPQDYKDSWYTFIDERPTFWTKEKLSNPYYASKFKNVAKVTGCCGNESFDITLDVDCDYIYEILASSKFLENKNVEQFINRYSSLLPESKKVLSLLDFLLNITYATKTKKEKGCHIHWKEHSLNKQINSSSCMDGKEFEIFTEKHLIALPPSRHRDDGNIHYSPIGVNKVQVLDGLYNLLLDLLGDCFIKKKEGIPSLCTLANNQSSIGENNFTNLNEEQIVKLLDITKPFYNKYYRNKIVLGLAGLFCKCSISEESTTEFTNKLTSETNDEESSQRLCAVKATYEKAKREGYDGITGITLLEETFTSQLEQDQKEKLPEVIKQINEIVKNSEDKNCYEKKNIDNTLPEEIRAKLERHIYKIISFDYPKRLIVANTDFNNIILASVFKNTTYDKETGKITNVVFQIKFGNVVVDARPTQVIIYDNPIDKTRKYEITFATNSSKKKTLVIGPTSLESIIDELQLKNKILKKSLVQDSLSAIISAFEEKGKAIVNDNVTTPGYYIVDGMFVANETNQLPVSLHILSPISNCTSGSTFNSEEENNSDAIERILGCISLLEELNKKWKKGVFSTLIKWAVVAPFSYILKQNNKWIPFVFLSGWANAGKTTLGKVVLSVWRKYTTKTKEDFLLGFGSISSEARFGNVVSRDTYPRVINEVGSLSDPHYSNLLEIIKNAIENLNARGRIENYRNYINIPALSPFILSSNHNPPECDTGLKRRMIMIHFDKNDSHQENDAKEFERWFEERKDILGILGDFAAAYLKGHHQLLTKCDADWKEIARVIVNTFYQSVSKKEPAWINDIVEQNTLEESKEDTTIELRSFLINEINEHYNKYVRTIEKTSDNEPTRQDIGLTNLLDRINFCLENKIIPYIYQYKNKQKEDTICITSPMLREISRRKVGNNNLNTLRDIANEIPSFTYDTRVIGGKSAKAAYGPRQCFKDFLTAGIEEEI